MDDQTGTAQRRRQDASRGATSSPPPGSGDAAVLVAERRLAYERAIATLDSIDDQSLRSARTAVLLLGFVTSAVGVAGPAALASVPPGVALWLAIGVLCLLGATLLGIDGDGGVLPRSTSSDSDRSAGSRSADGLFGDDCVTADATERQLLVRYEWQVRTVHERIEARAAELDRVQSLLRAGIVSLAVAAGAVVLHASYGVDGNLAAAVLGLLGLTCLGVRETAPSGPLLARQP
ncbi:MAG: hypothetical protein ACOCSD_04920 [Halolamina sp.]